VALILLSTACVTTREFLKQQAKPEVLEGWLLDYLRFTEKPLSTRGEKGIGQNRLLQL
jgi:hypothetical protein